MASFDTEFHAIELIVRCATRSIAFIIGRRTRVSSRKIERIPFDDRNYYYFISPLRNPLSLFFQRPSDNFIMDDRFRY